MKAFQLPEPVAEKLADAYLHRRTRADRLRAMTDEELAEAFATACPEVDTVRRCCKYFAEGNLGCRACWLDWLKEKAPK